MNLEIKQINVKEAMRWLKDNCALEKDAEGDFAIAVNEDMQMHGLILMKADGCQCKLIHLYTDGTALVGSILYGAAWRAAKALGYKQIII